MDVREAQPRDRPAIRDVARRSLEVSYTLSPGAINNAVEEWYDENRLTEMLADDDKLLLVGDVDGQVVAVSDCERTDENTAELLWLHVDPDYRGEGTGQQLYNRTLAQLEEIGVTSIQARVLADNSGGNTFYQNRGLSKVGEETVEIDGTNYIENVYTDITEEGLEALEVDEKTVYIDHDNAEKGSVAPFRVVYEEKEGKEIYGYWCSKCGELANAMDAMGRIQCDNCGNARKPTRWDSAYL